MSENFASVADELRRMQNALCDFLAAQDGKAFQEDAWRYAKGAGGGITRIMDHGNLIEKGGVNFSSIEGSDLPRSAATAFAIDPDTHFRAAGVSLVMHPWNPHVPVIHFNVRYFEAGEIWWFGGGLDLTPYYPRRPQIIRFHQRLKALCKAVDADYHAFKKACDAYFYIKHRGECRGVGGICFDHLRHDRRKHLDLILALGRAFPDLYGPFITRNRDIVWTREQRAFQLCRRSRYVEFNLLYDRGTLFGLQSGGRIESILMSLPPVVHWAYKHEPMPGSPEAELIDYYLKPRDWAEMECDAEDTQDPPAAS